MRPVDETRTDPGLEIASGNTRVGPSFTVQNRVRRAVWNVVYAVFFRPSPRPLHGWRAGLLRLFGARVARGAHVYPKVKIWAPWNLDIGERAGVADEANLYSMALITLEADSIVSQGAHLCAGTHDFEDPDFPLRAFPITVKKEAWVAAEVFVHPGVTIGEGAVIGARSVVVKDMPEWMVCSGHPCKPLKPRKRST